ncbi:MAG: hypothetical protein ABSB61_04810 [Anaerolineales bacterium]|jgi:predicted RNA-binding Zn-ribbon protein involved in translation (DUF1610 family)
MTSEYNDELLRQAEIYIKSKEFDTARGYVQRALDLAGDTETRIRANYYMSLVTSDPAEKRKFLEETLAFNPTHPEARRALAILDGKLKPEEIADPDHLPPQSVGARPVEADRFTCPGCGGRMVYTPDGHSLTCESCSRQEVLRGQAPEQEQDFFLAMATGRSQRKANATQIFHCQGCGAMFLLPARVLSETCPYCGSVQVVHETRDLVEPDTIIPMAFDQNEAALRLAKWMGHHRIEAQAEPQAPRGLYLPVWVFDIVGDVPWKGRRYRDRQFEPISGDQSVLLHGMVIPATSKLADLLPFVVSDFNLSEGQTYDSRYLAGWAAEVYERNLAEASLDARGLAVDRIRQTILASNSNVEGLSFTTTNIFVDSFRMALVPIWLAEYYREGKAYRVVISGQKGAVHGETPTQGILDWLEDIIGAR